MRSELRVAQQDARPPPLFSNPTLRISSPAWLCLDRSQRKDRIRVESHVRRLPLPYQFVLLPASNSILQYTVIKTPTPARSTTSQRQTFPSNRLRSTISIPSRSGITSCSELNVQQQLSSNLTALVAYVDRRRASNPSASIRQSCRARQNSPGYLSPRDALGNTYSAQCNATDPNASIRTCAHPPYQPNFVPSSLFYVGTLPTMPLKPNRQTHGHGISCRARLPEQSMTPVPPQSQRHLRELHCQLAWFDPAERGLSDFNVANIC